MIPIGWFYVEESFWKKSEILVGVRHEVGLQQWTSYKDCSWGEIAIEIATSIIIIFTKQTL